LFTDNVENLTTPLLRYKINSKLFFYYNIVRRRCKWVDVDAVVKKVENATLKKLKIKTTAKAKKINNNSTSHLLA